MKDSTSDEDQVSEWWRRWPDANIGLATGQANDIWVLDVDHRPGKKDGFASLKKVGIDPGKALLSMTGGGGRHYIYRWDSEAPPVGCAGTGLEGVDVRGDGGYIVAPPSMHASGVPYQWDGGDLQAAEPQVLKLALQGVCRKPPAPSGGGQAAPWLTVEGQDKPEAKSYKEVDPGLVEAMQRIPPNCPYDHWYKVGMALHEASGGSPEALMAWDLWSAGAAGTTTASGNTAYIPGECAAKWRSFGPALGRTSVGPGSIIAIANTYSPPPTRESQRAPSVAEQAAPPASSPWRQPEPLAEAPAETRPLPLDAAFPPGAKWARDMASDLAQHYQVGHELPALLMLPIILATMSGKARVRVCHEATDWTEPPVLWVIAALASGGGKSPVMRKLVAPLDEWEGENRVTPAMSRHRAKEDEVEAKITKKKRDLGSRANSMHPDRMDAASHALAALYIEQQSLEATRPMAPTLVIQDATTERLVDKLAAQGGRALVVDAEGDIFDTALGRYATGNPALAPWLKSYDGDAIRQERVSGDRYVPRGLLNVAVATQPEALSWMANELAVGKGFVGRFISAVVPHYGKRTFLPKRSLESANLDIWGDTIRRYMGIPVREAGDEIDIFVSREAYKLFRAWGEDVLVNVCRPMGADDGDEDGHDAWTRKAAGRCLRIALALHLLEGKGDRPDEAISAEAMRSATVWTEWSMRNYLASSVDTRSYNRNVELGERVVRQLARRAATEVTASTLARWVGKHRGEPMNAKRMIDPIDTLCDLGWLRRLPGYGATRYSCHPEVALWAKKYGIER